jgi:hypothetical protein
MPSARLPALPSRSMLGRVFGSSLFSVPRALRAVRSLARRSPQLAATGALLLGAILPARAAFAQESDAQQSWFDEPEAPPADQPAPEPYYDEPQAGADAPTPDAGVEDNDPSALTTFRPALDPYGSWTSDATYGTVWVPRADAVGADFAPYVSRGHWALTADNDWIWVSDYPFGWAVFHYGRWVWISGNGWAWVPGRTYANAWVMWRVPTGSYAYVGWAPMPPRWGWFGGGAVGLWYAPPVPYVFCPSAYMFDYHVRSHIVHDHYLVHRIADNTHVYPTPYHSPAQPTSHAASAPRSFGLGPSQAPRGPRLSAARVPATALPAERTAPPPNVTRLSRPSRPINTTELSRQRIAPSGVRSQVVAPERRSPEVRRPVNSQPFRSSSFPEPPLPRAERSQRLAPDRVRVEPRSAAPARIHVAPSMAPRSFSPSGGHMRSGGGGHRR